MPGASQEFVEYLWSKERDERYSDLDLRVGNGAGSDHSFDPRGAGGDIEASAERGEMVGV